MKKVWTAEMVTLLREVYPKYSGKELQRFFPKQTLAAIKTRAKILGIKKLKQRFRFTPEQIEILKCDYAETANSVFVEKFGCSLFSIYKAANRLGLKKSKEFIREQCKRLSSNPNHGGRKTRFQKGLVPANKGKKMPAEIYEKTKHTFFKTGHTPANTRKIFSERVTKNGYVEIKIAEPNKWKLKHRLVWEQHNGKIPKGYNIQFKDGNSQNCDISNLYIISRSEQMNDNTILRYPENIRTAMRRINKIIKLTKNE